MALPEDKLEIIRKYRDLRDDFLRAEELFFDAKEKLASKFGSDIIDSSSGHPVRYSLDGERQVCGCEPDDPPCST